jgi:hypothetical protein
VGSALLTWLSGGSPLGALVSVSLAICALVFGLVYRRYFLLLGADRRRPTERRAYDALRASLAEGNLATRLYSERLTRFLDWIDRFFGDAGMADRTLFPHAFWLKAPAPLWTAPSFDRCLLLALLYPFATIFAIWAVSGQVGRAESALGLKPDVLGWQRGAAAAGVGCLIYFLWAARPMELKATLLPHVALVVGLVVTFAVLGTAPATVVIGVAAYVLGTSVTPSGIVGLTYAMFLSCGAFAAYAAGDVVFVFIILFAVLVIFLAVLWLRDVAVKHRWQNAFLSLFFAAMILVCLGAMSTPERKCSGGPE